MSLLTAQDRAQTYLYNQAGLGTGNQPSGMAAADFNQDGRLDLAVTNQADNTVSVILSKPNGTFAVRTDYAVGMAPMAVVNADFNGDGIPDLAVANSKDNTVSILLGAGAGKFGSQVTFPTGATPVGVVAGDFNGDGKPDLAVLNSGAGTISILLGNGDGTIGNASSVDSVASPIAILAGDFNGDGTPDIVTLNAAGGLSMLLNNGKGSFKASSPQAGTSSGGMAACDLNNDGKLDLAVTDPNENAYWILLGNGDGTFKATEFAGGQLPSEDGQTLGLDPGYITCGDFNGDGILDLAFSGEAYENYPTLTAISLGNGDGTFQTPQLTRFAGTTGPVLAGDFNNDNYSDLAAINAMGNVVLVSLGGVLPTHTDITLPSSGGFAGAASADFTGDGKIDAGFLQISQDFTNNTYTGFLTVVPSNGDGTFQSPIATQLTQFGLGPMVAGDFNGDRKADVAMSDPFSLANGSITVVLGNGDGTFGSPIPSPVNLANPNIQVMATGDFNGDGKTDIAVGSLSTDNTQSPIYVLLSNGDGTFHANLVFTPPSSVSGVSVADFNHDGKADIAISIDVAREVMVFLGNGDGTFSAPITYPISNVLFVTSVTAADFNGDGNVDLSVVTDQGFVFFAGNGDGTFKSGVMQSMPSASILPVVGDFNGDGKADIGFSDYGWAAIFTSNGDGTLNDGIGYVPTWYYSRYLAGDFNSDNSLDLMQLSSNSPESVVPQTATVWLSSPAVSLSATSLSFTSQAGATSAAQAITLTNVGNGPLSIADITASGSFSQTNNCPSMLNAGQGCTLNVTFTPTTNGTAVGSLTLADNAYPGTQVMPLIGSMGSSDFAISALSSSAAVTAGGSASYAISILGIQGFSGTVQLSCNGAPTQAACALSRSTVGISRITPEVATLTVTTTARTAAALTRPAQRSRATLAGFLIPGAFFLGSTLLFAKRRGWAGTIAISLTVTAMIGGMIACGGGGAAQVSAGNGGSSGGTTPSGTPAGTYTLTIGATSGILSHSATVSLTVR